MAEHSQDNKKLSDALFKGAALSLKLMPLWAEAIGAGAIIALILDKNPAFRERLTEIDGKVFLFEAKDIGKSFFIHIKDKDIKIVPHVARTPDVTMKGDVRVLIDVFTGKEDADTVFFSRRLEITGDTAVAIHFKNILAALS